MKLRRTSKVRQEIQELNKPKNKPDAGANDQGDEEGEVEKTQWKGILEQTKRTLKKQKPDARPHG